MKKIKIKQATKQGYIEMESGGVADLSYATSTKRRGRVQMGGQICPTLLGTGTALYRIYRIVDKIKGEQMNNYRIRKLTPTECYVLMGMTKEDCDKCAAVGVSNSQLYKQAGNGLATNCVQFLAEHLYKSQYNSDYVTTDEKMFEKYGTE